MANLDAEKVGSAELAAFCEGVLLNAFRFERYKQKEKIDPCTLMIRASGGFDTVVRVVTHANRLVEAVNLERDWAHEPANRINPVSLAERAVELAANLGIKCTILDDQQLTEMGAGAITAVGKGSQNSGPDDYFRISGQRQRSRSGAGGAGW